MHTVRGEARSGDWRGHRLFGLRDRLNGKNDIIAATLFSEMCATLSYSDVTPDNVSIKKEI